MKTAEQRNVITNQMVANIDESKPFVIFYKMMMNVLGQPVKNHSPFGQVFAYGPPSPPRMHCPSPVPVPLSHHPHDGHS
jgi:hypothetical protein